MKTVLVVEDSGSSRDITSHFLQQGGFRILEAADGAEALKILGDRHVDLILTDIMMPNMDGWAFYREVRKNKQFNLTPFVFLSVLDEMEEQIKGLTLGVDDYITKPVTPQQLIARVNTALMRSERLEQYFYRNPVTDLETPGYLRYRLAQEAARCREAGHALSMVLFGISNYVALARGHAQWFAESAARKAGQKIRQQARDYDVVADMGVGRFAVLLPNLDAGEAKAWADKVTGGWDLAPVWPETEQRIGVDINYVCEAVAPGKHDIAAMLEKMLGTFDRKW